MEEKAIAVTEYADGIITVVLGRRIQCSPKQAVELIAQNAAQRQKLLDIAAKRDELASQAAALDAQIAKELPEVENDAEELKLVVKALVAKIEELGTDVPEQLKNFYNT